MAENINDTPARREQVEQYEKDPTHPHGKPYSTKQQAAMEAIKTRKWYYHPTERARIFEATDEVPEGWFDSRKEARESAETASPPASPKVTGNTKGNTLKLGGKGDA